MLATLSDRLRAAGILIETYANQIPGDVASLNDAGVPGWQPPPLRPARRHAIRKFTGRSA
jgi:hypothetical protein